MMCGDSFLHNLYRNEFLDSRPNESGTKNDSFYITRQFICDPGRVTTNEKCLLLCERVDVKEKSMRLLYQHYLPLSISLRGRENS